jgi:mRNA interferase MazF
VISPSSYNRKVGLAIVCPITSRLKGYPFEVELPEGLKAQGANLPDITRRARLSISRTQAASTSA